MLRRSSFLWAAALGLTLALASPSWAQHHQSHGSGGHGVPVRSSAPAIHHGSVSPHTFSGVPHSAGVYRGSAVPQHWATGTYGSRYNHAGTWHNGLYGNHYASYHHYPYYYGRNLYSPWFGYVTPWWLNGYWNNVLYQPYYDYSPYDYNPGYSYYPNYDYGYVPAIRPVTVDTAARIDVVLPDPDAAVWFDGKLTTSRGTTRSFQSPSLEPGKSYWYTVKATWNQGGQPVTAERAVEVRAGADLVVDFTKQQ